MSPRDIPFDELPEAPLREAVAASRAPKRGPAPLLLLVLMTAIGPFSMQILIPSLPAMARQLGVTYGTIQLTLTLYLIGVAAGQLLYGPLSDRFGRRPLLLAGLAVYTAASLAAALAPSAGLLILARIGQAVGSCAGLVLGRAMIRDSYPRERAASVLGLVSTAMAVAPMVAPLLGSLLEAWFHWRAAMLACAAFGLPLWLVMWRRLPETLAAPAPLPGLAGWVRAHLMLLRAPAFRAYAAITGCASGVFFAFASGGPLVVIGGQGAAPTTYAAAMMLISLAWMSGTFSAARLTLRLGVARMLGLGTLVTGTGGVLALLSALLLPPGLLAFFLPMVVVALGNGMTQPNAVVAAVSVRPGLAGTASGLVGAAQMGLGALMTVATAVTETGSGTATAIWMLVCAVGTLAGLRAARRAEGR
ncbi:MAG TPA: multidrug effflux MFS transporter [Crenalkalicoccus sp.]|nr:multidrug effflux MFS transporter [Crenalkalicoccus sp.]